MVVASTVAKGGESLPLFNGRTFEGWTTQEGQPGTGGWEVEDGVIHLKPGHASVGNIVTAREFGDFDLSFEWKIAPGGNGGVKYRVREYDGKLRGCEYQVLDDRGYKKGITPRTSAGALYDLYEPSANKRLKSPGEFNSARIVVRDNRVQHWLNGRLVVDATIGSDDWNLRVGQSKFNEFRDFALNQQGKLMLTDHGSEAWYRNFKFLDLGERSHQANSGDSPQNR